MIIEMQTRPESQSNVSTWSSLQDIEKVDGNLSERDNEFLSAVGEILGKHGATDKFAVTLLHSHLSFGPDEALVEALEDESGHIVSTIRKIGELAGEGAYVPKAWMFSAEGDESKVNLHVLWWAPILDLVHGPVVEGDVEMFADLGREFRRFNVVDRFGIALVGILPAPGMLWTEGTDFESLCLIQEQLPADEVLARDPIRTHYKFEKGGKYRFVMNCCERRASWGHTTRRHPWGIA